MSLALCGSVHLMEHILPGELKRAHHTWQGPLRFNLDEVAEGIESSDVTLFATFDLLVPSDWRPGCQSPPQASVRDAALPVSQPLTPSALPGGRGPPLPPTSRQATPGRRRFVRSVPSPRPSGTLWAACEESGARTTETGRSGCLAA